MSSGRVSGLLQVQWVAKSYPIALSIVAILAATTGEAMPKPKCDMLKTAEEYLGHRFPSFDPAGLKRVITEKGNLWQLTYEMREDMLGGVPTVTIDKRTCKVVRAVHTQ